MAIGSNTDPNFNVQSPANNQTLVYDSTQQAFVNATLNNSGSAITGGANVGTGGGVFKQASGTDLQFRSLVAGNNVTITENTDNVTISAVSSVTSGLNLGGGEGLFVDITTGNIRLKSITAGTGITLTASGTEVSVSVDSANVNAGTLGGLSSSAFLQKSDNLASVASIATARTNLGVYSKTEADTKYQPTAGNMLPDADNTRSIGDNSNRYSDVYAVEFHGTATRAGTVTSISDHEINDLLDVDTTGKANGHVLKYNGSAWVSTVDAGATNLGALTDVNSAGAANGQVLIYNSTTSAWEPGNMSGGGGGGGSTTLVGLTDTPTNYAGAAGYFVKVNAGASAVEFVADPGYITGLGSLTTTDLAEGTNQYFTNARADARIAAASINALSDVDTSGAALNNVLKYNGSAWIVGTASTDLSANTTTDLAEGTNLYYTEVRANAAIDAKIAAKTTDDLSEGATNLYYTTARANTDIDARLTSTGVTGAKITNWDTAYGWGDHSTAGYLTDLTGSTLTSLSDVAAVTGAGDDGKVLYYDHATTSFKWKTESGALANTDALAEGSTNLYYTDARADARITAAGITGAKVTNWDTAYSWGDHSTAGYLTSVPAQSFASLTGKPTTIAGYGITDLNASIDSHLNQSNPTAGYVLSWNGLDYAWIDNTGYTSFNTDFDTRLATKSTTNLSEGTNLYYTDVRADARVNLQTGANLDLSSKSTTNLAEGTNLYYTDTRVDSRITGNWLIDEDNMASDSATKIPSQQSVKAYVDSQVATANELGEMTDVTITSVANNQFLKYNSSTSQWENATVTASTAAGVDTQVQFNDGGVMGGDSGFVFNKTTDELTVGSVITTGVSPSVSAAGNLIIETTASNGNISLTPNGTGVVNVSSDIDMGTNVISDAKVGQWDTAYGWGDHSTAGYLTAETNDLSSAVTWANVPDANITQSSVTQHQAALTITESQISDLQSYLTAESDTLATVTGRGAITTTTAVIPFYYANQSAFPNATTYHGAIAHSHSDGAMYFAHGGSWNKMANDSQLANSTNWDTAYGWGDHSTAGYLTSLTGSGLTTLSDVAAVTGAGDDGKVLYYDHGTTSFKWKAAGGGTFGIAGNTGTHTFDTATETLTVIGTTGQINATVATNFISLELDSNINSITSIAFEGSTADANETKLQAIDPTADRTISLPDASGTVALTTDLYTDSDVDTHLNQSNPTSGFVLSWNGSDYAWVAQSGGSALTVQDEGSSLATAATTLNFVGAGVTASGSGATKTITIAGGGSAGTEYEEFKINYATDGSISSISDTSSGLSSVTIDSAVGGDLTVNFTGYTTPPLSMMMYGYVYSQNKYVMNTLGSTGTTLREIPGGGSSGSPTAFGSFANLKIRVSESETGAARSFGTTTHAWVRFVMGA